MEPAEKKIGARSPGRYRPMNSAIAPYRSISRSTLICFRAGRIRWSHADASSRVPRQRPARKIIESPAPFGTPEEVRAEVKRIIEVLGKDGGYMLSSVHTIMSDVPPENILAMVDAVEEFGWY